MLQNQVVDKDEDEDKDSAFVQYKNGSPEDSSCDSRPTLFLLILSLSVTVHEYKVKPWLTLIFTDSYLAKTFL